MNDPMRIMRADHREAKELLQKLGESEEGSQRDALLEELTTKLSAHMEMEEELLYPLVGSNVGPEDQEEAHVEHELAREGLKKLSVMSAKPGFGAAVEMLLGGITHHVEEEEKELLPELKDSLSREEWAALGDAIVDAKKKAGLPIPAPAKRRSTRRKAATSAAR